MGIVLRSITTDTIGGAICPMVICDVCKERILDSKEGTVLFDSDYRLFNEKQEERPDMCDLVFVHKDCDRYLSQDNCAWLPLTDFLKNLCRNTNVKDLKPTPFSTWHNILEEDNNA